MMNITIRDTASRDMRRNLGLLRETLSRRPAPEKVLTFCVKNDLLPVEVRDEIKQRFQRMVMWQDCSTSFMCEEFEQPVFPAKLVAFSERFTREHGIDLSLVPVPEDSDEVIEKKLTELAAVVGLSPVLSERPKSRTERNEEGNGLSRRAYRKAQHMMTRWRNQMRVFCEHRATCNAAVEAGGGLHHQIPDEIWMGNPIAACAAAYVAARANRRSLFTNGKQSRKWDALADLLMQRAVDAGESLEALAWTEPTIRVVSKLASDRIFPIMSAWYSAMETHGRHLERVASSMPAFPQDMVVRRGMDSTSWNLLAEAFNSARRNWMSCLEALRMDSVLDDLCPGKVLRLMAGDVACWHLSGGGKSHADTTVWNSLPRPWDVLSGKASLTRSDILSVTTKVDVQGWVAPIPPGKEAELPTLTPTTLHGVAVPGHLYATMAKMGFFSGKSGHTHTPEE